MAKVRQRDFLRVFAISAGINGMYQTLKFHFRIA